MNLELKNKELEALIYLLEDPDEIIYENICDKLISFGEPIIPILENSWENNFSLIKQNRIENIIHHIQNNVLIDKLKNWSNQNQSLKEGVVLVNTFHFPSLDIEFINNRIKKISKEVWLELNYDLTPMEQVNVINNIFYRVNKFDFIEFEKSKKSNLLLESVLNTKKGNNIILGLIYCFIAQELKIPIYGIVLPDQFILVKTDKLIDPNTYDINKDNVKVEFYINPNNGSFFTKKEITIYLNKLVTIRDKSHYYPSNNKTIIKQYIKELIFIHESQNELSTVDELWQLHDLI